MKNVVVGYVSQRIDISMFMLEGYISVLLLSYSISSGALQSPDLLLSYSMIALLLYSIVVVFHI